MPASFLKIRNEAQVIHIQPLAPPKPRGGEPCNGCGVCCLVAPCPLGMLISGRRHGACKLLRWDDGHKLYRCGVLLNPAPHGQGVLPPWLGWLSRPLAMLAHRWIAAGSGCDSNLEVMPQPRIADNSTTPTE
jgi:hypothetical protein